MDRGAWRAELDPAERLSVLGRKSIGAFPVSQRLAHLFLIHETAAPKRTGDVLRVKRLHSRGTSLPSSHVRYIPRASTSADSVLPFTAYNTTWDF